MYDIITIGTAAIDYIISINSGKRGGKLIFKTGQKYHIDTPIMRSGGGALNAAVTCARSGLSTALVSEWGADASGVFLENVVRAEHIHTHVTISRKKPTATSLIFVSPDGERTIFGSRGALANFSLTDIPLKNVQNAKWAYITTGMWSPSLVEKLVRMLVKARVSVAVSPSGYLLEQGQKALMPLLKISDVIIMNRDEASLLTGIPASQTKKVFTRLDELVRGIVVMTDSARGATVSDGARMFAGKAFDARAIDETGAGDAFGGAFIAGLIESGERCGKRICSEEAITYALRRASANACSVVEHYGATEGILTKKDFLNNKRWKKYLVKITHL